MADAGKVEDLAEGVKVEVLDEPDAEAEAAPLKAAVVEDDEDAEPLPSIMSLLWPGFLCLLVDFLGLGISIPILPYLVLEMGWELPNNCPELCPAPLLAGMVDMCGEIAGCGTSIDVGANLGCFSIGQVIGNFVMGRLSDKIGRKPVVMMSILASSGGYLWCGLAPTLGHLYAARAFSGIAGGTLPVIQAMVLDVVPPTERPKYFGICGAMLGLAFIIGPALGSGIAAGLGKRASLFGPFILAVITLIVASFKVSETRKGGGLFGQPSAGVLRMQAKLAANMRGKGGPPPSAKMPLTVYICAISQFLSAFCVTTMTSMTAIVWIKLFNFGTTELGIFLAGAGLIGLFVNVLGVKFLVAKIGAPRTALLATFLLSLGIGAFTFIDHPVAHTIFFLFTLKFGYDLHMPTMITIAGDAIDNPMLRGRATGMVAAGMSMGNGLCPFIAGPLLESSILNLQHQYGSFSHLIFLIGAAAGVVEFALLVCFVGVGRRAKGSLAADK